MTQDEDFYAGLDGEVDCDSAERVAKRVAAAPALSAQAAQHRALEVDRRFGRRGRVVTQPLARFRWRFVGAAPTADTHRIDPHRPADPEQPAVEPRSRLELAERSKRLFHAHLCKVVRVGRVAGQRMGEPPQARPHRQQLDIERGR